MPAIPDQNLTTVVKIRSGPDEDLIRIQPESDHKLIISYPIGSRLSKEHSLLFLQSFNRRVSFEHSTFAAITYHLNFRLVSVEVQIILIN